MTHESSCQEPVNLGHHVHEFSGPAPPIFFTQLEDRGATPTREQLQIATVKHWPLRLRRVPVSPWQQWQQVAQTQRASPTTAATVITVGASTRS